MEKNADNCYQKVLGNKRYLLSFLACLGLLIPLAMRCEIGIAIIKMTEYHNVIVQEANGTGYKTVPTKEVSWSYTKISLIESSFFIGYALFSIPGGFIATVSSANIVFGIAVLTTGILNLIVPILVQYDIGFSSVFVVRIFQGMAEGCLYPSVHGFWRYWAPIQERSKLITFSFFGMALGPIIGYPVSGILTNHYSWATNFYFWGVASIVWVIIWLSVSRKCPSQDGIISESEKLYIEKNTSQITIQSSEVPWLSLMSSVPVWAIIVANVGRNWTYQFSFSGLPSFFNGKFSTKELALGLYMSLPYMVMAVLTPIGGVIADFLISKYLKVVTVRKIFNTVGFGIAGICFLILPHIPYLWLSTTVLSIGLGCFGIGISGFGVNHLDIADIYAGLLMGISNGLATLAGVAAPIVYRELTEKYLFGYGTIIFFTLSGIIHLTTVIFYAIFASGENQKWSDHTRVDENIDMNKELITKDS